MNYTVLYLPAVEQELAALWLDSSRRDSVTRAAHLIDQALQVSPEDLGESRPQGLRIYHSFPLGMLFRVSIDKRLVEVVHVWEFK